VSAGKPTKFIIGIAIVLAAIAWLAFTGFEDSKSYYRTVREVQARGVDLADQRIKVGGAVEEGSIEWDGNEMHFRLVQDPDVLPVVYRGKDPVPDTFKENGQAVVEGRILEDGTFEAVKIQAKCASKYEAKYGGGAKTTGS